MPKSAKKSTRKSTQKLVDGINPKDVQKLRSAIRQVWSWSVPWRLVKKRCTGPDGFEVCEKCKKRCPKIFVDHLVACGDVLDRGYIDRMFVPSSGLQGLCKTCHAPKTRIEAKRRRMALKAAKDDNDDFF